MLLPAALRIPLKITLFPIRIVLSVFTGAMTFILGNTIIIRFFAFASGVLFLAFLAMTWSAIFVSHNISLIARILMPSLALLASYITSPFSGALKYALLLIERIEDFNSFLKTI